jgi:hypothetical protein
LPLTAYAALFKLLVTFAFTVSGVAPSPIKNLWFLIATGFAGGKFAFGEFETGRTQECR